MVKVSSMSFTTSKTVLPVGFVNVEAAKELIMETGVPYIVNVGRKGGSNIAAAICNALIYSLVDRG